MRVLNDPVTVSGENGCICHCAARREKAQSAEDPQVRKPAENIFAQLPMKAWCDMGLQGFAYRRDNGLIVRLLLDEAGVFCFCEGLRMPTGAENMDPAERNKGIRL